jgi:hypothetical protein
MHGGVGAANSNGGFYRIYSPSVLGSATKVIRRSSGTDALSVRRNSVMIEMRISAFPVTMTAVSEMFLFAFNSSMMADWLIFLPWRYSCPFLSILISYFSPTDSKLSTVGIALISKSGLTSGLAMCSDSPCQIF